MGWQRVKAWKRVKCIHDVLRDAMIILEEFENNEKEEEKYKKQRLKLRSQKCDVMKKQ